jgi:hypothetical protein
MFLSSAIIKTKYLTSCALYVSVADRETQVTKDKLLVLHVIIEENGVGSENEINQ